jgi:prolipoprotein diacylglyceryltransferase/Fe-S-cluster containining protein
VTAVPLEPPTPSPPQQPDVPASHAAAAKPSPTQQMRREVARGLQYAHFRANANTNRVIQLVSTVEAATDMLEEQGLLDRSALARRKAEAAGRIGRDFAEKGLGVQLDPSTESKYDASTAVRIDCESRIHLCHAACCKLHFPLSREDVQEGTIRWDFGNPYVIAQGEDGWCVHLDRGTKTCGVYSARPRMCRTYDCRNDARIWLDFEKRIVNPRILDATWPRELPPTASTDAAPSPREMPPSRDESGYRSILDVLASRPQIWSDARWFLSAYGLFLAVGFAAGTALWLARAGSASDNRPAWLFVAGLVVAAYVGSRLLWIVEHGLVRLLSGTRTASWGHTFYGGFLAALGFAAVWLKGHDAAWRAADLAAPSIALGFAVAKLGCFGSGCCLGIPTTCGPTVRYSHWASKAVAVHKLTGVPLVPLQLYEGAYALIMASVLWFLPDSWIGSGRVLGAFLVVMTVGRALLLPFRYREADARASLLLTGLLHLLFVTTGIMLLSRPAISGGIDAAPLSDWSVAAGSLIAAALVLALFGMHRQSSR